MPVKHSGIGYIYALVDNQEEIGDLMAPRALRIAFDIGGVLSKYPDELRLMAECLTRGGADVFVLTDMPDRDMVIEMLKLNGFEFIAAANVNIANYTKYGEGCKAEILRALGIDVFLDDHIGYVAEPGCPVRCLVMPDASRPYYHEDWNTGTEGSFGRNVYCKQGGTDGSREV